MAGTLAPRAQTRLVRDAMCARVVTVVPEMTVRELVMTFLEEEVRGAPVLSPSGKILGIVSEADVMRLALRHPGGSGAVDCVRVAELMRAPRAVATPDQPLRTLLHGFLHDGVRRVLVVENDILVGIVTPVDALRGIAEEA